MPDQPRQAGAMLDVTELSPVSVREAVTFLDAAEAEAGGPLVDEAERRRLAQAASGDWPPRWYAVAARREDGRIVGYGGLAATGDEDTATGDLAVTRVYEGHVEALRHLLRHLAARASSRAGVWCRQVTDAEVEAAATDGFVVQRRLGVFGRRLPITDDRPPAVPGYTIRTYRPDEDDAAVVDVLASAYAGTPDGHWDLDEFTRRRALPWFRDEDLLVAVDGSGWVGGLHWLKRRDVTTGEVHNLAVHPDAQGQGLGPLLLRVGLDRLAAAGCLKVILWTDRANPDGVRLYRRMGFQPRWDDVAFKPPTQEAESQSGGAARSLAPGGTSL